MDPEDGNDDAMETHTTHEEDMRSIFQDGDVIKNGDHLLFNPFNPVNREITLHDVQTLLQRYGLQPVVYNLELYKRAFVHSSYIRRPCLENAANNIIIAPTPPDCLPLKTKSNERLEFVGDGVLELITKYYLYRRFPKADEGFMTEKKIALVKNEHIGKLAYDMQLNKYLILSKYAEVKKTRTNLKKLGCLFEALIGAIFMDFNKIPVSDTREWFKGTAVTGPGFQMAQLFVENVFETHVDWVRLINTDDNFKNILQVKIQKEFKTTPDYLEISHSGDHGYVMGVFLSLGAPLHQMVLSEALPFDHFGSFLKIHQTLEHFGKIFVFLGSGTHKIKKMAEQIASQTAIDAIH